MSDPQPLNKTLISAAQEHIESLEDLLAVYRSQNFGILNATRCIDSVKRLGHLGVKLGMKRCNMPKNHHAQALGRLGGSIKSPKKAESSRINGKLGGRPKKPKP